MYKFLTQFCCCFAFVVSADSQAEQCDLRIQKLTPNTLAFFYQSQAQTTPPSFYVKAMMENATAEVSVEQILNKGQNLINHK